MRTEIESKPEVDQFLKELFQNQVRDEDSPQPSEDAEPELGLDLGLTKGSVKVDGRIVPIPVSVATKLTVNAVKALARVYRGMALYLASGRGWKRLRDTDTIELKDQKFQSREIPQVQTAPRLNRD